MRLITFTQVLCVILCRVGMAFDHVLDLTEESMANIINRPETKLWLVAFYAPWCEYSKSFLHILDDVAPSMNGKMSLGRVDCSVQESFCKHFDIASYPTVKWYMNGTFHEYKGNRDHDAILSFATNMNSPVVSEVDNYNELVNFDIMDKKSNGALFVLYHSTLSNELSNGGKGDVFTDDEEITTLFQAAHDFQATNTFVHLKENDINERWVKALGYSSESNNNILFKFEKNLKPIFFRSEWSSSNIQSFIEQNNEITVPLLNEMNAHDFGSRDNKYLAVAILDPSSNEGASRKVLTDFRDFASSCSQRIDNRYQFLWMDGRESKSFLQKYSISLENSPQVFVLDYPNEQYWTNPSQPYHSIPEMQQFLIDILEVNILPEHIKGHGDVRNDELYRFFMMTQWFSHNMWLLNIHLIIVLFCGMMMIPQSAGKLHDYVEIYFMQGCIDPLLEYLGLMNSDDEKRKKKND